MVCMTSFVRLAILTSTSAASRIMPFCLMRCRSCCASDCAFRPLRHYISLTPCCRCRGIFWQAADGIEASGGRYILWDRGRGETVCISLLGSSSRTDQRRQGHSSITGLGDLTSTLVLACKPRRVSPRVRGSQRDRDGESRWPLHDDLPQFDPAWRRLPHTEHDAAHGVRGYFPDVMDALRCHQDLQSRQGRGLLLAYVAKYVAKWSDSSYDEWMSDASCVTGLCRKVLFEYHPLEPEMVLQLTQGLRQWEFGTAMTGRRSARAPHPHVEARVEVAARLQGGSGSAIARKRKAVQRWSWRTLPAH